MAIEDLPEASASPCSCGTSHMLSQPPALKTPLPRKRRKEERPGEILEAALEQFLARGYSATRLGDVAALAGVAKGTTYNYFENKGRLFLSVIERNTQCQVDGAMAIVRDHQDSMESLIRVLLKRGGIASFRNNRRPAQDRHSESTKFPAIAKFYLDSVIEPLQAILADVVRRGVASGEFREIDAEAVSRVALDNMLMPRAAEGDLRQREQRLRFRQGYRHDARRIPRGLIRPTAS